MKTTNIQLKYDYVIDKINDIEIIPNKEIKLNRLNFITDGSIDKHKIIDIGIKNLTDPNFITNPLNKNYNHIPSSNDDVPIINFATIILSIMHEKRHYEQINTLFMQKNQNENAQYITFDYISNISCPAYYKDCVKYNNITQYRFNHNYLLMAHEIDAEKNAIIETYGYLYHVMNFDSDTAEQLTIETVNNKIRRHHDSYEQEYRIPYFVNPTKPYTSLEDIINDFDKALEKSKETHKYLTKDMMNAEKSDLNKICYKNTDIFISIANEPNGLKQSKIITCAEFAYKPEMKKEFPVLDNCDLSEENTFGYKINIKPKFDIKRILPKLYEPETNESEMML